MPKKTRPSASGSGLARKGAATGPSTPELLGRRLLFFTGKGGVGKSTVSAAMALLAAQQGQRVLLVSADGRGDIAAFFEKRPVGFRQFGGTRRGE